MISSAVSVGPSTSIVATFLPSGEKAVTLESPPCVDLSSIKAGVSSACN